jgi:hypothetical protein
MVAQTLRLSNANYLWLLKQGKSVNQIIGELREKDEDLMKDIENKTMVYETEHMIRQVGKRLDSMDNQLKLITDRMEQSGYDMSEERILLAYLK